MQLWLRCEPETETASGPLRGYPQTAVSRIFILQIRVP